MNLTLQQYNYQLNQCRALFVAKNSDYGTAWRVLRPASLTDQLLIKARRIRNIQLAGQQSVADPVENEFRGLVNYSLMALMQLDLANESNMDLQLEMALQLYDRHANETRDLMVQKNTDYGEVWRDMRVSSMTDLILMKLLRVKQIEDNQHKLLVSEGVGANYADITNYALFSLILLEK